MITSKVDAKGPLGKTLDCVGINERLSARQATRRFTASGLTQLQPRRAEELGSERPDRPCFEEENLLHHYHRVEQTSGRVTFWQGRLFARCEIVLHVIGGRLRS